MSSIKRSTYQKAIEENKKLKSDIEALVMRDDLEVTKEVTLRWNEHFSAARRLNTMMREIASNFFNKD